LKTPSFNAKARSREGQARANILWFQTEKKYFNGMKAMQIEYPESWTASAGSSPERFENEARMALAMKLFEMGRLTSGQAAQLAGVSRMAFLFNCPQWNVPAVNWDAAELAAEFKPIPS
jgi:predicted HTH domain antitoxin